MPDLRTIQTLVEQGESASLEVTESTSNLDKFCEAICAFANDVGGSGQPGFLVIGLSDRSRQPAGSTISDELLTRLAGIHIDNQILPTPSISVDRLDWQGAAVAVVTVQPSDNPPVRYKGVVHVRRGPRRGIATPEEERRLAERSIDRARTWDSRACAHASIDDIALDLFTLNYLPQAVSRETLEENHRSVKEQLSGLRFFDLRRGRPTNGCVLLFGKDPLGFFPGAYVQFVRYAGTSQAAEVSEERRINGDLLTGMRRLRELADDLAGSRPVRRPDSTDRTVWDYPPRATLELLMNAAIHRNYDNSGTPVSVTLFDDRMEIMSPGGLHGDLTRALFPRGTSYRNPLVAEAAKSLGYVNRFGRGIAVATQELLANGSAPPEFEIGENHVLVLMRKRA